MIDFSRSHTITPAMHLFNIFVISLIALRIFLITRSFLFDRVWKEQVVLFYLMGSKSQRELTMYVLLYHVI